MSNDQLPVVIDNGSEVIKAGLAGSREPQFIYPNIIGRVKGHSLVAEGARELFVGEQAQDQRTSLSIRYRLFLAGRTRGEGKEGEPRPDKVRRGERKGKEARRVSASQRYSKCTGHKSPRIPSI